MFRLLFLGPALLALAGWGCRVGAQPSALPADPAPDRPADRALDPLGPARAAPPGPPRAGDQAADELRGATGEFLPEPMMSPRQVIERWSESAQGAARVMLERYGPPDEVTPNRLIWHNNGPWRRTVVHREERPHLFPFKHVDVLEQTVSYRVPPERFDDLARFNGSIVADRTGGTLSVRCGDEGLNFLALNLADELINGRRSVEQARGFAARVAALRPAGRSSPYLEGLLFRTYRGGLEADADKPVEAAAPPTKAPPRRRPARP